MDKYLYKISNALLLRLEIACNKNRVSLDEWDRDDNGVIPGFTLTFDGGEDSADYVYTTESVKQAIKDVLQYEKDCKQYAVRNQVREELYGLYEGDDNE